MLYSVENLSYKYPSDVTPIFDNMTFEVGEGEIFCILGPSGCGKTTLLKILAGLIKAEGQLGKGFLAEKSFVFQEPRLLPWSTVKENLEFSCGHLMLSEDFGRQVERFLEEVGLLDYQHHYPHELSGGMQQRIALVRAFLYPAKLMLMDEPFKSLDVSTRLSVLDTFNALWQDHPRTMVLVTHDPVEAALLADRVIILNERPTKIRACLENSVERAERRITNKAVSDFQSQIYEILLERGTL